MIQNDLHEARIVIVDDNPVDNELLMQILYREGFHQVLVISDPRDAVKRFAEQEFDLVILDFNMPYLDGLQVLEQFRGSQHHGWLPVLMLTAQDDRELRIKVLRAGARDFLTKPIDRTEVVARIRNLLEMSLLHNRSREQTRVLERREADLQAILNTVVEGVIIVDEHGRIERFNGAAERLFHYGASEVVGQSINIIIPEPHRSQHDGYLSRYFKTGEAHVIGLNREVSGLRRGGQLFSMELTISEVKLVDRRVFVGICRDISDRKRAEHALHAAKAELEARVAERTSALTESNRRLLEEIEVRKHTEHQLERARDKALEASQLKSMFLANVSHEIRTPLNGMLGMLSLLLDSGLQADQQDYARTAYESGELLLSLINDLLDFSKSEAGKLVLEKINYDFREVVHDVVHLFDEKAACRNLDVAVLVAPEVPPSVIGDPSRVRQVVSNLVGNAMKFTEQGEVEIRLSVDAERSNQVVLRFSIRDTGVGIPSEHRARIFESFTQVDGSTTRKFGGTGLGLAICRQLVELMGGAIGVQSEVGVGSTFWFTIPQEKGVVAATAVDQATNLAALRIVLVGDAKGQFLNIKRHLQALAISFDVVAGATKLIDTLRAAKGRVDVVIMDVASLDDEGLDVVRAVKADAGLAAVRIVLLASGGLRGQAREAREAGVSAYITKPMNQERLRETLIAVMRATPEQPGWVTRFDLPRHDEPMRGTALVVEDNPVNQKVAVKILAKLGLHADVAMDGQAGIDAVRQHHYDLVLMDCLMPGMDGFQATCAIRALEAADSDAVRVPIIAMTANVQDEDRKKCLVAGMDDFVAKPVTLDSMRSAVDRWLR